jgi:hypothetical protein
MRQGRSIAVACLVVFAGIVPAQEQIPLPAPDPTPAGQAPPPPSSPDSQLLPPRPVPADSNATPSAPYPPSSPPSRVPAPPPYVPPYYPNDLPPAPFYPPLDRDSDQVFSPLPDRYPPAGPPPGLPPLTLFDSYVNPVFWFGLEGLVWWTKTQPVAVPLITTGPAWEGANAGNLGMPGTVSLNSPLDAGAVGGFRLYAGGWFNADHTIGMDGSFFILGQQTAGFGAVDRSGVGNLVLNEPVAGAPFNTQVSAPGVESGSVLVAATTQFGGADVNLLGNLYRQNGGYGWTINVLGGYRYLQLDESLTVTGNSNLFTTTTYNDNMGDVLATAPPGSAVTTIDQFTTRNQFNGGQLGLQCQYLWRLVSITGAAKVALGDTYEEVRVNGNTTVFPVNGSPVPLSGGNFASLQVGRYSTNRFAVAPEAELKIGYQVTPYMRAQIGYNFLYLSNVVRPGNQIDNTYDGATHPLVPMAGSSFWAQGLTLGLQFSF